MKYMKILLILVLVGILASAYANAELDIGDISVEVEDIEISLDGDTTTIAGLEKGDIVEVDVTFKTNFTDDLEIEAELSGDGNKGKVSDSTDEFAVHSGTTYNKKFELELPLRMDQDQEYQLKIIFSTRYDHKIVTGTLDISSEDHSVEIKDIVLSPENEVKSGRALLVTARIKNRGTKDEEDVKVKASIPALGISASDYIDELDAECPDDDDDCDDSTTSEELYMRIPDCAEPGEYTVKACVEFDDGDEEVCETTKINVVESDTCIGAAAVGELAVTGKTIITIGPETQDIAKGGSAMYPVTIANQGAQSKTYSISVDSADWADFSVTPSNVLIVGAGESKAAYIAVAPKATATGLQVFSATIKSGETVLKQVPLRANILGAPSIIGTSKVKRALEVGLVVLVVLLVILGLIIGFNKLKGSEEEEGTGEEKTYY